MCIFSDIIYAQLHLTRCCALDGDADCGFQKAAEQLDTATYHKTRGKLEPWQPPTLSAGLSVYFSANCCHCTDILNLWLTNKWHFSRDKSIQKKKKRWKLWLAVVSDWQLGQCPYNTMQSDKLSGRSAGQRRSDLHVILVKAANDQASAKDGMRKDMIQ